MELEAVVRHLGIEAYREELAPGWEESRATLPSDGIPFLRPEAVRRSAESAGLGADVPPYLVAVAARIEGDPALAALVWHCGRKLAAEQSWSGALEALAGPLGEQAGACNLLLALSLLPEARRFHASRGVPEDICRATYGDAALWCEHYAAAHGLPGISVRIVGWLQNHLRGRLYRLGRLQFMAGTFRGELRAFRNARTGAVLALAEDGVRFDADGRRARADAAGRGGWQAVLGADADGVTGCPISPLGRAVRKTVRLPAGQWRQELAPGDPMLDVHIPAGEPMTPQAVGDSIERALAFFPRYFPEHPFNGFMCYSWFLDTRYDGLLAQTSNIVRLQREFYLFPTEEEGSEAMWRIFGQGAEHRPLDELPAQTSMQRTVLAHLRGGGSLGGGGFFYLVGDLPWGRRVYRRMLERGGLPI